MIEVMPKRDSRQLHCLQWASLGFLTNVFLGPRDGFLFKRSDQKPSSRGVDLKPLSGCWIDTLVTEPFSTQTGRSRYVCFVFFLLLAGRG